MGPSGVRPSELRARAHALDGWASSADDLFDWLRARVSHAQLVEIASADYSSDVPQHLAALERMCTTGHVLEPLAWHPGEVVELTRWESGDHVDHMTRGLSALLVRLGATNTDELVTTGPILVESCLALAPEAGEACERFVAWEVETAAPDSSDALIGRFLLLLLRAARAPEDPRLDRLIAEIAASPDARALREWAAGSMRGELWSSLIDAALRPLHRTAPRLSPGLRAIGFGPPCE